MKDKRLKRFILKNRHLFWWVKEKENISEEALVEAVLNYGTRRSIKELFKLLGDERAAEIFYSQISRRRKNYNSRTINFFKLYFEKHA